MVFYGGVNLFEAFNVHYVIKHDSVVKRWRAVANGSVIPTDYFSISIGLVTASIYLLVNMHKYFEA